MNNAAPAGAPELRVVDSALMMKVFYGFAVLAGLSAAIAFGGKWFGHSIAMAGYTDDVTKHEIVIGNDVITVPANFIRFETARRDGIAARLDLYLRYPQMDGYSTAARDDFNNVTGNRNIIFLTFEERMMSRDMSGRFEPIYKNLVVMPGRQEASGVTFYDFNPKSGYMNEVLAVVERPGQEPFVARCLTGATADESLAPCERDVQVGDNLSLTYRFSERYLDDWETLDTAITAKTDQILKTGKSAKAVTTASK